MQTMIAPSNLINVYGNYWLDKNGFIFYRKTRMIKRKLIKEVFNGYYLNIKGELYRNGKKLKTSYRYSRNCAYPTYRLYKNGNSITYSAHRLVAEVFIGPVNGMQVNHSDSDITNFHAYNLLIETHEDNIIHRDFNREMRNHAETIINKNRKKGRMYEPDTTPF